MITAIIDDKKMTFSSEAALIAYQSREDPRTPDAIRQQRHRDCESKASNFWLWRIKNGVTLPKLIQKVSDEVLEQQRILAVDRFAEYVALYPERSASVTKSEIEKRHA